MVYDKQEAVAVSVAVAAAAAEQQQLSSLPCGAGFTICWARQACSVAARWDKEQRVAVGAGSVDVWRLGGAGYQVSAAIADCSIAAAPRVLAQ
jgi:hypothetical protein